MFEGWNNTLDAVDVEIRIFVTDPDTPRSALVRSSADGLFLAGEPDKELVEYGELGDDAVIPYHEAWEKLILSCVEDGLEPVWDAANMISVHLAEKLGYRFDCEYVYYWINKAQRLMIKDPDKSRWPDFCGEYEELVEAFMLKKVWMKDGDLYGLARNDPEEDDFEFKLLPIGENTFGRANGSVKITFGDNCLVIDGITCKKL